MIQINIPSDMVDGVRWLIEEKERNPFAEIGIRFVFHESRVKRTERSLITKTLPDKGGRHETRDRE